ncbi:MAG TPA: DUF4097 family beta strand repeat-containing protein [Candidatus Baltobacteraceae bacterium]|nr:DUF4097 family beta strand repeat-containing protein [Candidatus Baltobacteraceae bacterium]
MRYSRTGIVAVLIAAEVFIGGAILWAFTGGHAWSAQGAGFRHVSEKGKTFAPIDAGSAPRVVIDDPDSRVVITPSSDGKVHVTDGWRTAGWLFNEAAKAAPLSVRQSAGGVSIQRSSEHFHVGFFVVDTHRTEVAVPPGTALEIQRCGGADVSGMKGSLAIHSVDGSLRLEDVAVPSIDASTDDGSIRAANLRVGGGTLHTNDGSIRLGLTDANLTVHAQTSDGGIRFNDVRAQDGDSGAAADYRVGTGGGSLQVSTQDGSIHISTNGAL